MIVETIEISELIAQMLINAPSFGGLILLIIAQYRNAELLRNDKDSEIDQLRQEKNEEIRRLQSHNDKLMNWCRREPADTPPLADP